MSEKKGYAARDVAAECCPVCDDLTELNKLELRLAFLNGAIDYSVRHGRKPSSLQVNQRENIVKRIKALGGVILNERQE